MLLVGNSKYVRYNTNTKLGIGGPLEDSEEYEQGGTTTGHEEDSGNEDDEDLERSEEIILPGEEDEEGEDEEEDGPQFDLRPSPLQEDDEEIFYRQLSYPPLPEYIPPPLPSQYHQSSKNSSSNSSSKYVSKKKESSRRHNHHHPRERLGVLTPMEEVTEPPSSAGTEASGLYPNHRSSRNRTKKTDRLKKQHKEEDSASIGPPSRNPPPVQRQQRTTDSEDQQKSILKSKSPLGSPDRRVQFLGAGSATQSERSVSPTESQNSEYFSVAGSPKKLKEHDGQQGETIQEEEDENQEIDKVADESSSHPIVEPSPASIDPLLDPLNKVETWQLGSDNDSSQEPTMSTIDAEFASILDDIIAELHSWDRLAGTGASITEINASRQDHLANISYQLTSHLVQVNASTVLSNLPQLIPLITSLLSLTEINFRAQLSSLNAVNVLAERLKDCKTQTGLKILPNADLTWLVRTLCDISSESSRSVLKSVGTAALASLVKSVGPEMICEPILLILMGNDEKVPKRPEGSGNIVATGNPGGAPKVKATALDTLTFSLLTFPRDAFDLEVVARLACHCLLHSKRRVRQAALECLSVISHALTPSVALPLLRKYVAEEEAIHNSNNASPEETPSQAAAVPPPPPKIVERASHYDSELDIDPKVLGPPSRIPLPIKVLEAQQPKIPTEATQQKTSAPPSPSKSPQRKGPTPASAISARISRHVLPTPNLEELVEYGVKIPANCQVLSRQQMKVGGQAPTESQVEESCGEGEGGVGATESNMQRIPGHHRRERLSSGGESCSSVSNIDYTFTVLEPILNTHHHGSGGEGRRKLGQASSAEFTLMAPDIEWILAGTGAVKRCDPATMLPRELSVLAPGTTKYQQQWNNNSGAATSNHSVISASENESDYNTSVISGGQTTRNNMKKNGSIRSDLLQDAFVQEPVIGRYYYPPPPSSHIVSPRTTNASIIPPPSSSSDPINSRYSSKSSYNLLPSKYSVLRNSNTTNQYRGGGPGHDLVSSPHVLLPGAYDNPYVVNGYPPPGYGHVGGDWHTDLGSLSKINLKPKPLEPIHSLREKFFESSRRNDSLRSDSQQESGGSTEEESEANEPEKTEEPKSHQQNAKQIQGGGAAPPSSSSQQRNQNVNQNNAKKPPMAPRTNNPSTTTGMMSQNNGGWDGSGGFPSQDEVSVRRQTEMLVHGMSSREYQVYHTRVEIQQQGGPNTNYKGSSPIPPPSTTTTSVNNKRVDVDSAGSNHTRDSGVSVGSVGGTKTPPSVHNTPPTQHRSPSPAGQTKSSAQQQQRGKAYDARNQLNRNWQSTPDVPDLLDVDSERRNRSGSGSSRNCTTRNQTVSSTKPAQVSTSQESMPVHRKPVLARRGQSMTRNEGSSSSSQVHNDSSLPRMNNGKYSSSGKFATDGFTYDYTNGDDIGEGGDHHHHHHHNTNALSALELRNSVSTGNLVEDSEDDVGGGGLQSRIPVSKSTYFEVGEQPDNTRIPQSVRVSRRDGGRSFEDHNDDDHHHYQGGAATLPSRRNPVSKATARIVPTKVYKGSFREINSRKASNGSTRNEVFPPDMKPVTSPKHALPTALAQLESPDWETNVEGFKQMVRMIRFDSEFIRHDLHSINIAGVKQVSNLRSQVCRAAILCFEELFTHLGRSMETDCEKIAEKLLDKSADTNKFIREATGRALEAMMINLTPLKGLTCLDLFGTRHRNAVVRCTAARLTAKLVETIGTERALGELSERLLPMLCKLLQEGSLDTRTSAKTAMSNLMSHPSFDALLKRHVPNDVLRHAQKNIQNLQKF